MTEGNDTIQQQALLYAASGLYCFPLKPNSKQPGTANGLKDATIDPDMVRGLFHPRYDGREKGIGIDCGRSGLLVVDLDGEVGMAQRDKFPPTLTCLTGRGAHLYYQGRGKSTVGKLGQGIDTRGEGGYVVAPPSLHPNGHRYQWEDIDVPVAELPKGLASRLSPRPKKAKRRRKPDPGTATMLLHASVERLRATPEGGRNNALNRECWYSRELERHDIVALLFVAEGEALGLPHEEVVRTVASALQTTVEQVEAWL